MHRFRVHVCLGFLFCLGSLLAGCKTVEMPIDPEGIDELRKSPCACMPVEFQPKTFEWVEVV